MDATEGKEHTVSGDPLATARYRAGELASVRSATPAVHDDGQYRVKLSSDHGATKYLSISRAVFDQIADALITDATNNVSSADILRLLEVADERTRVAALRSRPDDAASQIIRTNEVMMQVNAGKLDMSGARTVASWWQSPGRIGRHLAAFASTGVITPDLEPDIAHTIDEAVDRGSTSQLELAALQLLRTFVIHHQRDSRGSRS